MRSSFRTGDGICMAGVVWAFEVTRGDTATSAEQKHRFGLTALLASVLLLLGACSGVQVSPAGTETFAATGYTRYAWRSEAPSQSANSRDILIKKSPSIRAGVEEEMTEHGYELVDKADAEFLVEYVAVAGYNEGQLLHGGSNDMLYGSSVNRDIDGASADNAYALSGPVETGEMELVLIDAESTEVLWRVRISIVVEDANRVDHDEVRRAVRKGIAVLPHAG
jgi:hypothetical protein